MPPDRPLGLGAGTAVRKVDSGTVRRRCFGHSPGQRNPKHDASTAIAPRQRLLRLADGYSNLAGLYPAATRPCSASLVLQHTSAVRLPDDTGDMESFLRGSGRVGMNRQRCDYSQARIGLLYRSLNGHGFTGVP